MPEINSSTPRNEITIKSLVFSAPAPYAEGHVLTEAEASVLNQTLAENLRNNFAKKVEEAKAEAEKAGSAVDMELLQFAFDDYAAKYEFGIRSVSSKEPLDPIEREAMAIARNLVKAALQKEGHKIKDVGAEKINELAKAALDKHPILREKAKAIVEAKKAAVGSLNLDV